MKTDTGKGAAIVWFHGNISYNKAKDLLEHQQNGTFLVRRSESNHDWFVLAVKNSAYSRKVLQFLIRHVVGYIIKDIPFCNISKLVEYYTNHDDLKCGKLTAPLDKFELKEEKEEENTMPDELASDPRSIELYLKALEEGTESDKTLRVMVIGCYGQGKTSLVRRLFEQSIEDVETTNGIDLHKCAIINKDGEWKKLDNEDIEAESVKRLISVVLDNTTYEKASAVADRENFQLQDDTLTSRPASECSSSKDTIQSGNNVIIYERSNDYKRSGNITSNENQFADAANTSERSKHNIYYQNFNLFKTELERIESVEEETNTDNTVTLNIWDFGGQFVYYATHQIFLSKQAIYVLVFNLSIGLDTVIEDNEFPLHQKTMRDYLKFWVNSVNTFVGNTDGTEPAVILVGTHTDKLNTDSNPSDYFEEVRQIFDESISIHHIQQEQFAISNTSESEEGIEHLRSYISRLGKKQLDTRIPAKWILLEKALKTIKHKRIISFGELLEINRQTDSPIQTDNEKETMEQVKLFLSYHHAKGTFCYFDEKDLADHVVLDPQFLVDAFRCIITSEKFCQVRPNMRGVWKEFCNTAVLRPELFEEVWRQENNNDFHKFSHLLIEYLQKHHILAEVLAYDHESEPEVERLGYYIVPSLLKVSAKDETLGSFLKGKPLSSVSICYVLKYETMLPFIFQTCLAAVVGRWPLIKFKGTTILYDNAVACEVERGHAAVLMLSNSKLELLVVSLCPPDNVKANICDMFRRYVEMVMTKYIQKLHITKDERQFIIHIVVRCLNQEHGPKGSNETINIEMVQSKDEKIPCPDKASHYLKVRSILQEWFMQDIKYDKVPERKLTTKEYSTLSMAIGQGWQHLGYQLGLDKVTIDHIHMDKDTTAMRIYGMLLKWDQSGGEKATLNVLVDAIHSCDSEHFHINWDALKNIIDRF